jgi:DNA-directed RNA polymerase specialized sigma24 family protein
MDLPDQNPEVTGIITKKEALSTSLVELLRHIAAREDDRQAAERAFSFIYQRFSRYVNNLCYRFLQSQPNDLDARNSLMSNIMYKLFANASDLLHISKLAYETSQEAVVKAWLGKVAAREAIRMVQANAGYHQSFILTDDLSCFEQADMADNNENDFCPRPETQVLEQVLSECSEREQDIILTYYLYLDGRKNLPADEMKRLCHTYHVLPDNVNHIKHRTLLKIKQKCSERFTLRQIQQDENQ